MKKVIAICSLFFSLLAFFESPIQAQDYILTTLGDSLTGEVKPLLYGTEKRVQLIAPDKEKTTFSLFDVREYSHEGGIFRPMKGPSGYVFMKLLQSGYLSLYAYQLENQTRFDGRLLKKLDGDQLPVPNLGFKKYISQFLGDCPDVASKVKEGEMNKRDLSQIIDAYNACVESRTVDHAQILARQETKAEKLSGWDALEQKVRSADFGQRSTALEMITEIRKKIERQEKIPNFLIDGLKSSLEGTGLSEELNDAISATTRGTH